MGSLQRRSAARPSRLRVLGSHSLRPCGRLRSLEPSVRLSQDRRGRQGFCQEIVRMADLSPAGALELLQAGNARFVAGTPRSEPFGARVAALANGQRPFAVVLGCSDSRVPVEIVFDQAPGSLFVVRVAGNFLNRDGLGSIEFAIDALKSRLVVVLGHENCGAVGAALKYVQDGKTQPGHIQELVNAIAPAVTGHA